MLPLDVRLDASADECIETVLKRAGRIDVLVNNARYAQRGAIEELSIEEAKAQFETNFFGVARMVKRVLPIMREQRGGTIINISSAAGLTPTPFGGYYAASKFALEGYTETLRYEVSAFNIRVALVEPGYIKTELAQNSQVPAHPLEEYASARTRIGEARRQRIENGPPPSLVANCVLRIIKTPAPRLRWPVGSEATRVTWLRWLLPARVFERGVRRYFGLS